MDRFAYFEACYAIFRYVDILSDYTVPKQAATEVRTVFFCLATLFLFTFYMSCRITIDCNDQERAWYSVAPQAR